MATTEQRILSLMAQCDSLSIQYQVSPSKNGGAIQVEFVNHDDFSQTIGTDCEEWELTYVEDRFKEIRKEQEEAARQYNLAKSVFSELDKDTKDALKKYISRLQ